MLGFWRSIFYSQAAAPIFKAVADALGVTPQVCKEYCTSGVITYGLGYFIMMLVIIAVIVGLITFLRKKKGTTKPVNAALKVIGCILAVIAILGGTIGLSTYKQLVTVKGLKNVGNSADYNPDKYSMDPNSPIQGKTLLWLGSSVWQGFGTSESMSPALWMDAMTGTKSIIEVKGGTLLANVNASLGGSMADQKLDSSTSYYPRLTNHTKDTDPQVDLVVVQLSTNDSKGQCETGTVDPNAFDISAFDGSTTIGSIEQIISYARDTWGAKTLVIGGSYFEDEMTYSGGQKKEIYLDMIDKCHQRDEKWGDQFEFLDLWHNDVMYEKVKTGDQLWRSYMSDAIHPTKKGYAEWWGPYMIQKLYEVLG